LNCFLQEFPDFRVHIGQFIDQLFVDLAGLLFRIKIARSLLLLFFGLWVFISRALGVALSRLIRLGAHDVVGAFLHLCDVVSPAVELLESDEVEGVYEEGGLYFEV